MHLCQKVTKCDLVDSKESQNPFIKFRVSNRNRLVVGLNSRLDSSRLDSSRLDSSRLDLGS